MDIKKCSLITAIKTPYLESGHFDLEIYDSLVENQIKHGVEGIIVGGTTGEGHLMSWDEHIMLIAHSVNKFGSKLKIIGNTGSNSTSKAVSSTSQGFAVGMHASLQINPYYGKTSLVGMIEHFTQVLDLGPAIIYNVPGRTGQDVPPSVIEKLAQHQNFLGVKECVGNERVAHYVSKGINCWSGNDDQAFAAKHSFGAAGVISVAANLVPGLMRSLMDNKSDDDLNDKLVPLLDWLFSEPNPICLNTFFAMTGATKPVFRLPYYPLTEEQQQVGIKALEGLPAGSYGEAVPKTLPITAFTLIGSK